MSVLIKGMEMPSICDCCDFCDTDYTNYRKCCRRLFEDIPWEFGQNGTLPDCPLVEVKEPHGRMIDADEPMTKISTMMQEPDYQHEGENWIVGLIMARDAIDEAPTVIEAEDEEY